MWAEGFAAHGLRAEVGSGDKLSDEERLALLKGLLAKNTPVFVRIGNGYLPNGKYSGLLASIIGHWITLWGYEDAK